MPASAPVFPQHHNVNSYKDDEFDPYDLDTDADSSAYTDLSQVSPVSRTADSYLNAPKQIISNAAPFDGKYGVAVHVTVFVNFRNIWSLKCF